MGVSGGSHARAALLVLAAVLGMLGLTASAAAKPGDLIVSEYGPADLVRVNPHTGHVSPLASGGPISSADYLTFEPSGKIAITDEGEPGIFRANPATGGITQLSDAGDGVDGPYGIDADPKGNLIVADYGVNAVLRVNPVTGAADPIITGGWLDFVQGAVVDPHKGTIFVTDTGGAVDRVKPNGARSTVASGAPLSQPWTLARAPDGTLFVTDNGTESLYRVNPRTGGVHKVASGVGHDPYGVTVGLDGKVYTTDLNSDSVKRVNPANGHVAPVATVENPLGITVQPPKCAGDTATVVGSSKADTLKGSRFHDVIAGLGSRDRLKGFGDNDRICGGGGRDRLVGGPGNDFLDGGGGNDFCDGGPGRDKLKSC